jgi:predicted dehydrogenase
MLKVGIIGCGAMGSLHATCWLALPQHAELVAIADVDGKKAKEIIKKHPNIKFYSTGEELLEAENELDVIDICVPTFLHTKYAVDAMKKVKNVFIEKPVCLNEQEAELLLKTQEETGAKVQIGQVVRFMKGYAWLKDVVDKGTYGKVVSGVFKRLSHRVTWSWENWFNDYTRSGTVALDLHIHDTDFVRYLMGGNPDNVDSKVVRDSDGVIQQIFTTYTYGDAVITTEGCWDFPPAFPFNASYIVRLEKATVVLSGKVIVYLDNGEKIVPELVDDYEPDIDLGINISALGAYYTEIKYFIDNIINGNGTEIAPLSEGIESARLIFKEIELNGGAKK